MLLQDEVCGIFRHLKERKYKDANYLLQNLREKTLNDPFLIESVLVEGYRSSRIFRSFPTLVQSFESETLAHNFCDFLTKIVQTYPYNVTDFYEDFMETSFSGYMCTKSAKLKEAWLRLFRKVITHSAGGHSNPNIFQTYAEQLFDHLASKQAQSVVSGLCLSLATVVSYAPTAEHLREQILDFLKKLLSEQLTQTTKKPEFVALSAILSSISKIICFDGNGPKYDDVEKFYNYSVQILLANLDKICQYKPIRSACKLLKSCANRLNISDWGKTMLVMSYLQTLISHKNSALAKSAQGAYVELLISYRNRALVEATCDDSLSSFPGRVTAFLMNLPPGDTLTSYQLSFRLKCLSILMPVYKKYHSAHESVRILSWTAREIVHLVAEISDIPVPPKAYCLPDLIESVANALATYSSSQPMEELWRSLKLAIIGCFEAYPRLSQNVTERMAYCIFDAMKILSNERYLTSVINEAFYHAVLQTCSHSPFDLEDGEVNGESEVEEVVEGDLNLLSQPRSSFQTDIPIPRLSYREYLPLWRTLLGLHTGPVRKERYACINAESSAPIFEPLLTSSLAILKRLDLSYAELSIDTGEMESQVVVKSPQDVLILLNMAAFLEHILPDISVAANGATVLSFLQTCLELVERYPLLSGLYRLLRLAVLLAKQSGLFKGASATAFSLPYECHASFISIHLRSFATSLLEALQPAGALSVDDLSTARCSCLLSLPLSVFSPHPEDELFDQLAHVVSVTCQLTGLQARYAEIAAAAVSAVESWLNEIKPNSSIYSTAFGSLVPALTGLLGVQRNESTTGKVPPPPIGQRSLHSNHKAKIRRTLRAIARRPTRLNFDSKFGKAQMKVIEIIGRNARHWELLNLKGRPHESEIIFGNIMPSEKGVFNDLTLCLPFPDLRPYMRLSDIQLFSRLLRILLWRPNPTTKSTNQISASVSRQARVSAAEYLHEYIVLGLIKQCEMSPNPSDPIGESDSQHWFILFHVTFTLGADIDQLICRPFQCLAFQLVHWFAGYRTAGLCEARLLQKVILRTLNLTPPEDDICGFIDSHWPLPELIQARRAKLASACLRDFLKWMNAEATGNKRRCGSIGDQTLEDLLQLSLDGMCQNGAAAQVFTDTMANLLSSRPEMALRSVYLLIDAFKQSLLSAPSQSSIAAALKRAVGLLTELIKKTLEDFICDGCVTPEKQPRLTRTNNNKRAVEPLKPTAWEAASVPSCLRSLLLACRDPFNGKLFQQLVEQVISSASLRLIPEILPDTAFLISTFEWRLDSLSGFVRCLDNYAWLLSGNLITDIAFFEAIQLPESQIIAFLKRYCGSEENMGQDESVAIMNFLLAILHSRPGMELSSVFYESHAIWNFLGRVLLKPVTTETRLFDKAVKVVGMLPKACLAWTMTSLSQLLELHNLSVKSGEFALADQGQISDLTEILLNISLLLITTTNDLGLRELFSGCISPQLCQRIINMFRENAVGSSDKSAAIAQAAFAISSCLNYQITCDADVLLKAINQSNECLICPTNLLTILGFNGGDAVQLNDPNVIVAILLKSLSIYSSESNRTRTNQLCDGVANAWHERIEPLLKGSNFLKEACVDLLEAVISLSQVELDRNTFVATYLNLLKTETLKASAKVKLLDMLAFFLKSEVTPTTFGLTSRSRIEIVEAVKLLLASNLPLNPQEFAHPSTKLGECRTLLRSVLSLLKTVSCPEAIQILAITFCRHDEHFMDEELDEALQCAMKRIWARSLVQEQLLTSALEAFEQAIISRQPSVAFINLWHRYFRKFIQPLLLYVDPAALERIGVRNIVKWTKNLEIGVRRDGLTVTHWMWRLLDCCATFYLLVVLYNRLPKTCLHGMGSGGAGSILKVFLGPLMLDPLRKMEIKGKELTAMLIGKAYATLKDALDPPPNTSLTHDLESTASTLRRALWSASLACLVATVSATQTLEKAYNCVLACDPLSRFLPADKSLTFPRRRSGKYRSAFIELREEFWLPSQRESYLRSQSKKSVGKGGAFGGEPNRGELLQGSSFSVEINRFMRASGTQIISGSNSPADLKRPTSSIKGSASPPLSAIPADFIRNEDVGAVQVNLEVDCLNTTSVMVCFVGLLKQMHRLGFLKPRNPNELPAILQFLFEQFTSSRSNANVRAFVVKVIINCTELFRPFAKLWLPVLITYASSGVEALVDSCGLSSLSIDLCLLLGEWGIAGDSLPSSEVEKSTAQSLLAYLMKNAWISSSSNADGDDSIPEGVTSALKNNLELFHLLAETWLPAGVAIPYKELLFELQERGDNKRVTFSFHLLKIILSSCNSFFPDADNVPLSQFISVLLKYVHQRNKALLTVVWECSGLLASKFTSPRPTSRDGGGIILQSRGLYILPLSHLPIDLNPLVTELWSSVNDLNVTQRRNRPSEGPITNTIEAACAAASHWPALAVHLANALLGMEIPESIEPATFSRCLRIFGKLMEDLKGNKLILPLEQTTKVEILQNIVNSNVLEMFKWGTEIVLFDGAMLMLRMVQFAMVALQDNKEFSIETRRLLILRLLRTLISTLTRPNSTSNSRRVAYRAFIEARQAVREAEDEEIEEVCNFGISYGLCAETDQQLRSQLRKHISQHCLNFSLLGGSPSLSRCLSVLRLLSGGRLVVTADQALVRRVEQHLVSTTLEMALEPAIKSAEFRHPFRQNPLDPQCPFKGTSFTRTSTSTSRFLLDPVVLSGTQQLLQSQTQAATLVLQEGSAMGMHLMETQRIPSTSASSQINRMFSSSSPPQRSLFGSSNTTHVRRGNSLPGLISLSRVEELRRRFAFPATIASQSPDIHIGNGFREFFKHRTIQRQHAETASAFDTPLNESARLCRRHRLGALPDVETLTPEALLKPLIQLAEADPLGCGPVLLGLTFKAVIASAPKIPSGDVFLKEIGGALTSLLLRGQTVCLPLMWDLSGLEGGVLYLLPEPTLLAASALSAGLTVVGTLVMEEAFCAAAMKCSKGIHQSLSTPSPWTATTRRFFTSSLPVFVLPHEEFEIISTEGTNNQLVTTTAATCWWQLTRLYANLGLSDELLGWLCDRWIAGSKSPVLLERLGTAIVAKVFGDYEAAFMQLSDLLISSAVGDDADDNDKIKEREDDGVELSIWSTCPVGLNAEIQLVCREELLQCLALLGSWKDLDVAATATATSLIRSTDDPSWTAAEVKPSTSTTTIVDEFASLWKDPYLMESVVPQIIHSRLQQCLLSEINQIIALNSSSDTNALNRFRLIMESGLRSTSQDFESKFAYELAVLSVLCGDLSRAQLRCKSALEELTQTWSSKECRNALPQKAQLLIELKEFLEVSAGDAHSALKLFHTWQERCSIVSEELVTSRLFFLSKMAAAGHLSPKDQLLPVAVNFRLECSNAFLRMGNARRAINQLTSLHELIQMLDQVGDGSEYRRLAWCSAFSRAWISAYSQDAVFCSSAAAKDNTFLADLENGLLRCLSSNSHCIEIYEALRKLPSMDNEDGVLAQFSHAVSTAQILSAFHDFQTSGRLSDLGSRHYMTCLQPTLKKRFSQIRGLSEVDDVNFLESSAFFFFKRCVEVAMGVWSTSKHSLPLAEKAIHRRNLLTHGLDEALLEVANFCNARIDEGGRNRDAYASVFTRSVLTAMRMGAEGGRIRFGRVLQVEVARCKSTAYYDPEAFCGLTKHLAPWMFFQWFDKLLNALVEGAVCLVADVLRRIAQRCPQALALPFRVLMTSACGWDHDERSLVERFTAKLIEDGKGDAVSILTELASMLSKHVRLSRLLAELEYLDDPDIVFKDWVSNYARKIIRSGLSNRAALVASCNSLMDHGFLRLHGAAISSASTNAGMNRRCAAEKLSDLVQKEFGHDSKTLQNIALSDFDSATQRIISTYKQNEPRLSRMEHFSQWLANFSSDEQDPIVMPGQCVDSSSDKQVDVTIERVDPNVKCLTSLRRPKLVRLLGNDGRWRGWLVKGGEDLRQDASIQRLLGFANYAIASTTITTSTGAPAEPLRTYAVVPVSSSRGLIRWLNSTTTLFAFTMNAMTVRETERYLTESNELAAKTASHSGDFLWDSEAEAASMVLRFTDLEDFVFSLRLLRRGLRNSVATSAEHFAALRHRLISSHASICAVHFILGVGDRHMGNFLLDTSTGGLVGIDFGYAFGVTLSFPTPEFVPIRLTASLRELLEPSGPAGLFGSTLCRTIAALRYHSSLFLSVIQAFIEDNSSADWSVYSEHYDQSDEEYQRCRLSFLRRKLIGHCPAELLIDDLRGRFGTSDWFTHFEVIVRTTVASAGGSVVLPPAEQVRRLVCLSTCPELLARMHAGWSAAL